jgi:hypothetical protein
MNHRNKSLQYKKEEHVELENSGKDHVTLDEGMELKIEHNNHSNIGF